MRPWSTVTSSAQRSGQSSGQTEGRISTSVEYTARTAKMRDPATPPEPRTVRKRILLTGKTLHHRLLGVLATAMLAAPAAAQQEKPKIDERKLYPFGPESQRQEGVPKGTVTKWTWKSTVFAGTVRDCWTYVPAQYDKEKPAAVMVFQDGGGYQNETGAYRVPVVFDNLIHKNKMPVTIGIFINPGIFPPEKEGEKGKSNRS